MCIRDSINRACMKAESVVLAPNPDKSETAIERTVFNDRESNTAMDTFAYDTQGSMDNRVNIFKRHVRNIIKAIRFNQFSEEEQ